MTNSQLPNESFDGPSSENAKSFIPPSLVCRTNADDSHETYTFLSEIPDSVQASLAEPCILGVDEAGRGPVLGPMVYAVAYCQKTYSEQQLLKYEFDDSKVLSHEKRIELLKSICTDNGDQNSLKQNVGWATTVMSARDISAGMLGPNGTTYNLNDQAHDTTIQLITGILKLGINVTEVYVDTVGPPQKYQSKLSAQFPGIEFTVKSKADALYPIVSVASICAKVTRDAVLDVHLNAFGSEHTIDVNVGETSNEDSKALSAKRQNANPDFHWGSGYPSDPRTKQWIRESMDHVFGWDYIVRFSWQTTKDLFEKSGGVPIEWPDDKQSKLTDFLSKAIDKSSINEMQHLKNSTRDFGRSTTAL